MVARRPERGGRVRADRDCMNSLGSMRELDAGGEVGLPAGGASAESSGFALRTVLGIIAGAICYYLTTQIAWLLCFPDSKVSLFFPPHAVLVSILLLVPRRSWWSCALVAAAAHF